MFEPSPVPGRVDFSGGEVFLWKDDLPQTRSGQTMQRNHLQNLYHAALALPYKGEWNPDSQSWQVEPELRGLTNGEVMVLRQVRKAADGDSKAAENVLDRTLGKPKQAIESTNLNVSWRDVLKMYAEADEVDIAQQAPVVDVQVSSILDDPDDELWELANAI
jgi:hypothetical protein